MGIHPGGLANQKTLHTRILMARKKHTTRKLKRARLHGHPNVEVCYVPGDVLSYRPNVKGAHVRYYVVRRVHTPIHRYAYIVVERVSSKGKKVSPREKQPLTVNHLRVDGRHRCWGLGNDWEVTEQSL